MNLVFAIAMVGLTVLMAVVTLARPAGWFTSTYPTQAVPTLERVIARDPQVEIFADVHYADWLIWEDPQLFSGRVAYDTSLETLTDGQLEAIAALTAAGHGSTPKILRPYGIWMLNPVNKVGNRRLLAGPGVRVLLRSKRVIIATHPASKGSSGSRA